MRVISLILLASGLGFGQQPIGIGGNKSGGLPGLVSFFNWFTGTGAGCTPGTNGFCTGPSLSADSYYFTAWLNNSSGLPKTSGLPIVGTVNDSANCGDFGIMQLDVFSWTTPNAAHIQQVNCVTSFNTGVNSAPGLWQTMLTSGGATFSDASWHSRTIFSRNGVIYVPVERQIHAGTSQIHDATFIQSPDSGAHFCNPYTLFNVGSSPGVCNSGKWQINGDAPICGAVSGGAPCLDVSYTDATHSNIMWKQINNKGGVDTGAENWAIVSFANQDCTPFPTCANLPSGVGIESGCDPSLYNCFMLLPGEGSIGRISVSCSIQDITCWQYYTCPNITLQFRCDPTNNSNWTSTFANRTSTLLLSYPGGSFNGPIFSPYTVTYIKEFKQYVMTGQQGDMWFSPTLQGQWNPIYRYWPNNTVFNSNFFALVPALGYTVVSSNPPHVQIGATANNYSTPGGTPEFQVFDLVVGKQYQGETPEFNPLTFGGTTPQGAGDVFSVGNVIGSFPRKGLIWSFDLTDNVLNGANWPYWLDRGNYSAAIIPCRSEYNSGTPNCGSIHNPSGTSTIAGGIAMTYQDTSTVGHFQVIPTNWLFNSTTNMTPSSILGNSSYSVGGVYQFRAPLTAFHLGSIWCTGINGGDNSQSQISLDYSNTNFLSLNWGAENVKHWQYLANQTLPIGNNYFIIATIQAATGCGSGCVPIAHLWVGIGGVLTDLFAGVSYTGVNTPSTSFKTPTLVAGPFTFGLGSYASSPTGSGTQPSANYYMVQVYNRSLSKTEVGLMYNSVRAKMISKGITIQ